jgi:uncharacterized glyoxalase superfamily protein PhnB
MKVPPISPLLFYRDPRAALDFFERAFGFETRMMVETPDGGVVHSESAFDGHVVMVVGPPTHTGVSPLDIDGRQTGHVHVQLQGGLDALCERAREAGARIQREPADQPYGDRVFTCLDPEGHSWSFGQEVQAMAPADWDQATGTSTKVRT